MKRVSTLALAFVFAASSAGFVMSAPAYAIQTAEEAEEFEADNLSAEVRTAVTAAQQWLAAEGAVDTAAVRAQLDAGRAAIQNDDDRFIIGQLYIQLGAKLQAAGADANEVSAVQQDGLQLALDSDRVEIGRRGLYWKTIGDTANAAGNHPAAISAYQNALRYEPNNPDASMQLASAQFNTGDNAGGFASANAAIAAIQATGVEVPRSWLTVPLLRAYEANDVERVVQYGAQLVEAYPNTQTWNEVLRTYLVAGRFDDHGTLDLLRLMRTTGSLDGQTANEYARLAIRRGFPGEAQAVYSAAVASGELVEDATLRSEIEADVRGDRADLDSSASNARSSATGQVALNTADALASYGEFDRAIELYRLAQEKGGIDASTVNLRLASALIAANRAGEAESALDAVTGTRAGIARFWKAWLAQQAGGAAAETPDASGDETTE